VPVLQFADLQGRFRCLIDLIVLIGRGRRVVTKVSVVLRSRDVESVTLDRDLRIRSFEPMVKNRDLLLSRCWGGTVVTASGSTIANLLANGIEIHANIAPSLALTQFWERIEFA
jgi:hypothetical protein